MMCTRSPCLIACVTFTVSWKRVCGRIRHPGARRKDSVLECHWGESTRSREVAASSGSCRSCSSGVAGIRGFAITSSWHQSVGDTSWPPGFCAGPVGDAQRTSSHIVGAHSHGRGCAVGVVVWFTAHLLGRTMWLEWSSPRWQPRFVRDMTPGCGSVCAEFSTYLQSKGTTWSELLPCLLFCEALGRGSTPAFWASWADTLPVIVGRHPGVARQLVAELEHEPQTRFLQAGEMGVVSSLVSWDLTLPVGKQQLRGHDHHSGNPTTSSQALCDLVGNTKPVPGWRNDTGRTCSPGCLNRCRRWYAPKQVLEQERH